MKSIHLLAITFAVVLFGCKKSGNFENQPLHGSYPLILDSTNAFIISTKDSSSYRGNPGDYWDFTSNGVLYIKEGTKMDTMSYSFPSSNKIKLVKAEVENEQDTIYYNSKDQLILQTDPVPYTPGGFSDHTVELGKQ